MNLVESVVKSYRSLRAEMPANERNERRSAFAHCQTDEVAETIKVHELEISTLANLSSLQIGNLGLLLLWHFVHLIVNIWYFALGLLKRYNSLDSNRVRYLAIVVDSKEAGQTTEVIKLLQHLENIGIKQVCLYDPKGLLKKSKDAILEKLACAKLYEGFSLPWGQYNAEEYYIATKPAF